MRERRDTPSLLHLPWAFTETLSSQERPLIRERNVGRNELKRFRELVWRYYRTHGRHEMPWRKTRDPYKILVSEIMLQQTQVMRVGKFYPKFVKAFPNFRYYFFCNISRSPRISDKEILGLVTWLNCSIISQKITKGLIGCPFLYKICVARLSFAWTGIFQIQNLLR